MRSFRLPSAVIIVDLVQIFTQPLRLFAAPTLHYDVQNGGGALDHDKNGHKPTCRPGYEDSHKEKYERNGFVNRFLIFSLARKTRRLKRPFQALRFSVYFFLFLRCCGNTGMFFLLHVSPHA